MIEVQPATIDQVRKASDGRMVLIDNDAANVAASLQRISRSLRLRYSPDQDISIVYELVGDEESLVTTEAGKPSQLLVKKVERLADPQYDFAAELDKLEAEKEKAQEAKRREQTGEIGERLAHALRTDLGENQSRVFFGDTHS